MLELWRSKKMKRQLGNCRKKCMLPGINGILTARIKVGLTKLILIPEFALL